MCKTLLNTYGFKAGDRAMLELNDWCGSKEEVVIEKIFPDGNCHLRDEETKHRRINHVNNLRPLL